MRGAMTKDTAVDILQSLLPKDLNREARLQKHIAITMAIRSLTDKGEERVHGEWLTTELEGVYCDRCGYEVPRMVANFADEWNYCPCCGAKMVED